MFGLLRRLLWPAALITAHLLLFTLTGAIHPLGLLVILSLIFGTNFLWIATGLYFSLRLRTVTFAVVLNLALPFVAYLGVGLVAVIIGEQWLRWLVWVYTPYAYFPEAIVGLRHGRYDEAMLLFAVVVSVAYVLLAVLLLIYTARRFDAIVGRAPQSELLDQPAVQAATAVAAVA